MITAEAVSCRALGTTRQPVYAYRINCDYNRPRQGITTWRYDTCCERYCLTYVYFTYRHYWTQAMLSDVVFIGCDEIAIFVGDHYTAMHSQQTDVRLQFVHVSFTYIVSSYRQKYYRENKKILSRYNQFVTNLKRLKASPGLEKCNRVNAISIQIPQSGRPTPLSVNNSTHQSPRNSHVWRVI